jgi:hypothetical protein
VLLQDLYSIDLPFDFCQQTGMVGQTEVEQRRHDKIVVEARVVVAVYAEVKVDGDHGIVDHPKGEHEDID